MKTIFPVFIADCAFGKGVFASRDISVGELILEFTGNLIESQHSGRDIDANHLQVGPALYQRLCEPAFFVNHSCEPNSGVVCNRQLIALRDIQKSEEVFFDYSTTMDEDCWTMRCACGTSHCRELIQDFRLLPEDLREKYLQLGIVQRFIADQWLSTKKAILSNR